MNDFMSVQVFKGKDDVNNEEFGLFLAEELPITQMIPQISSI